MRLKSTFAFTACLALTACGGKTAAKIDPNTSAIAAASWNGTLSTPSAMSGVVQVRGTASMVRDGNGIKAYVTIENATRGGAHPWHVHRGRCGYDNGILGSASDYPLLKVGDKGTATANASVDVPFPASGEYFVNVHASADNTQTIVACGNLAAPQAQ